MRRKFLGRHHPLKSTVPRRPATGAFRGRRWTRNLFSPSSFLPAGREGTVSGRGGTGASQRSSIYYETSSYYFPFFPRSPLNARRSAARDKGGTSAARLHAQLRLVVMARYRAHDTLCSERYIPSSGPARRTHFESLARYSRVSKLEDVGDVTIAATSWSARYSRTYVSRGVLQVLVKWQEAE